MNSHQHLQYLYCTEVVLQAALPILSVLYAHNSKTTKLEKSKLVRTFPKARVYKGSANFQLFEKVKGQGHWTSKTSKIAARLRR